MKTVMDPGKFMKMSITAPTLEGDHLSWSTRLLGDTGGSTLAVCGRRGHRFVIHRKVAPTSLSEFAKSVEASPYPSRLAPPGIQKSFTCYVQTKFPSCGSQWVLEPHSTKQTAKRWKNNCFVTSKSKRRLKLALINYYKNFRLHYNM